MFDFCVNFFYNKLTLAIYVPCGWYLWWSQNFARGSRRTIVEYMKWDFFVELPSRSDDVGIILKERFVLLINSSIASSTIPFWIEDVNHIFNYMYELIYFPLCGWWVLSYYIYIYIHLSNCALFGECILPKIYFYFS